MTKHMPQKISDQQRIPLQIAGQNASVKIAGQNAFRYMAYQNAFDGGIGIFLGGGTHRPKVRLFFPFNFYASFGPHQIARVFHRPLFVSFRPRQIARFFHRPFVCPFGHVKLHAFFIVFFFVFFLVL